MSTTKPDPEPPAFEKWARERPVFEQTLPVDHIFGDGAPAITFRIPPKDVEWQAITAAYQDADQRSKMAGDLADEIKRDTDLVEELKTATLLWHACRDAENPNQHAFSSPEVLAKLFDSDHIGSLMRLLEEVRVARGPHPGEDLDREQLEDVREGIVATWGSDMPERLLAPMTHTFLTRFTIMALKFWADDVALLHRRIDQLESQLAPGDGEEPPSEDDVQAEG